MKHDIEWLKFRIIKWLDKKNDDACWFNLVLWALGEQSFKEDGGYAYCGKCVETGRLKE
jgi:hypothetical protein